MNLRAAPKWFGTQLSRTYRLARPTFFASCCANSRVVSPIPDTSLADWTALLENQKRNRDQLVAATTTAYETARERQTALESKAVGVIQGDAVAAAILLLGASGVPVAKIVSMIGIVYIGFSAYSAGQVMLPKARYMLTGDDVRKTGGSFGFAEMGQATDLLAPTSLRTSNWVTASALDLVRGGTLSIVSALLTVFCS